MKVGIDGRALTARMGGTGRYVIELMKGLDVLCPEASFVLYVRQPISFSLPSNRWTVETDTSVLRRLPGPSWSRWALSHRIKKHGIDVFWAAAAIAPAGVDTPIVQTIFDLTHVICPSSMPVATRWGHIMWFAASLRESRRRIAISQGTSHRVSQTYGVVPDAVIRPVLDTGFDHPPPPTDTAPAYVLSVATLEPRKNLGALLSAMRILNQDKAIPLELWLVGGKGWGRSIPPPMAYLLKASWCKLLGYVDGSQLPELYANAKAFVLPSIYEGYGMPVAEAIACGTPVIATDMPELREAAQDHAIFVDPTPEGICRGLEEALRGPRPAAPPRLTGQDRLEGARLLAEQLRRTMRD